MDNLRKRKGVSPVIATVIIVAVTITVAVAVSYWISGISSQYTQFEKVEIQSAVFTPGTVGFWKITITLKNSGTKTATLTDVYVNDVLATPLTAIADPTVAGITAFLAVDTVAIPLQIESGATGIVTVYIMPGGTTVVLSSGTTVNIKIHSAGGMDYIKLVQLV